MHVSWYFTSWKRRLGSIGLALALVAAVLLAGQGTAYAHDPPVDWSDCVYIGNVISDLQLNELVLYEHDMGVRQTESDHGFTVSDISECAHSAAAKGEFIRVVNSLNLFAPHLTQMEACRALLHFSGEFSNSWRGVDALCALGMAVHDDEMFGDYPNTIFYCHEVSDVGLAFFFQLDAVRLDDGTFVGAQHLIWRTRFYGNFPGPCNSDRVGEAYI